MAPPLVYTDWIPAFIGGKIYDIIAAVICRADFDEAMCQEVARELSARCPNGVLPTVLYRVMKYAK